MNRAVVKLTLGNPNHPKLIRVGDVVRVVPTGEAIVITSSRGGSPRRWAKIPLWLTVWNWARGRGWRRTEVVEWYSLIVRGYRARKSPLPHRLP